MASIKILLWNKVNKEGKYPIAIRIIKDRKPSYTYIGHYIKKTDWDAKNAKVKKLWISHFGTKVKIQKNNRGKGKIQIEFYSNDDLQRILEILNSG